MSNSGDAIIGRMQQVNKLDLPLYPHQEDGVEFLLKHRRCILGDEMGLGKTLQSLAAVATLDTDNQMHILIISPKGAKPVWKQEVKKWLGEDVSIVDSSEGYNMCAGKFLMPQARFVVCNFEQAREFANAICANPWHMIIVDEAHKCRNMKTELYNSMSKICRHFILTPLILITGTPLVNNPGDLFSLLHLIDHTAFPSKQRFLEAWFYTRGYGYESSKQYVHKNSEEFQKFISNYMLRRLRKGVIKLPKVNYIETPIELEGEQKRLYKQMADLFMAEVGGKETVLATVIIAQINRLKQLCLSTGLLFGECAEGQKADELIDQLEELNGDKTVITSSFSSYLRPLAKKLEKEGHVVGLITGSTSERKREELVNEFQNPNSPMDTFLISTKAGGESITLTAANNFYFTDKPWTAAAEDQVFGRVYRIGQEKPVMKGYLKAVKTVEEYIEEVIDRKRNLSNSSIPISAVRRLLYAEL